MQLNPRYGTEPLITVEPASSAVAAPMVRQRQRLGRALAGFTPEQWEHPSRCEGWTNRDVVVHLDSVNSFWVYSLRSGLAGEPSRLLADFDPVTGPAGLVVGAGPAPGAVVLERYLASTAALAAVVEGIDEAGWALLAEAPPGHQSITAVVHHTLWDGWVHERDILLPLGIDVDEEADEIAACLAYVAALSPAFSVMNGRASRSTLALRTSDPTIALEVEVGEDRVVVRRGDGPAELTLSGGAVGLLEALSVRAPLEHEVPPELAWMVQGLAEVFDAPV